MVQTTEIKIMKTLLCHHRALELSLNGVISYLYEKVLEYSKNVQTGADSKIHINRSSLKITEH